MSKKIVIPSISFILVILLGAFVLFPFESSGQINKLEQEAKTAFDQADFDESIAFYKEILNLDPLHVNARIGLTKSYQGIARLDLAEMTLFDGIELLPAEPLFYTYLSELFINQSDIVSALSILKQGADETNNEGFRLEYELFLEQITVDFERPFIQKGHEREIQLVWSDEKGRTLPLTAEWVLSSDIASLQVTADETSLKAVNNGSVVVTATSGDLVRELEITVKDQVAEELTWTMSDEAIIVAADQAIEVGVVAFDADGEEMQITPNWTLKNELGTLTAAENQKVTFTALEDGAEQLIAEYDGINLSLDIEIDSGKNTLMTSITGEGTITTLPEKTIYEIGEVVELTAVPAAGWKFVRWTGDLSGTAITQTITLEKPMKIGAVFELETNTYQLSITKSGEGTVLQSTLANTINLGETVTVTARPSQGYVFEGWSGSITSSNPSITFVMEEDMTLQAIFSPQQTRTPVRETETVIQPKPQPAKEEPKKTKTPTQPVKEEPKKTEPAPTPKPKEPEKTIPIETPKQPEPKPEPEPDPAPAPVPDEPEYEDD
ncbi:InlB B-repeat-containing protein [Halalkalibacter akibai]|uniref:Bacterial repeat domain-containing protein n=1 Tax=Halalkalibacter akibai (strain ATCC 43226 / DSM 21942 / CIP 109018 / JCM 9157 / 1139) TaxID=1236973 RepID=W4QUC9_HALA3|nr:hypothetical protein [Halalkalibacter akibai]GAE35780.1 hypothetical protein JCM9157_2913 [Halalkalibacter akibai JCM 9157]